MKPGWKLFLLFAVLFAAAFGAERLFVPDVVPIAYAEEPQALWAVETAFVLRAIELVTGGVAIAAFVLMLSVQARRWRHRRAH